MSDDLYHQAIKDLAAVPSARLEAPDATAVMDNPLCGDKVSLDVRVADGRVVALGHAVKGCLLCKAAATAAERLAPGLAVAEAAGLAERVQAMLRAGEAPPLPGLEAFEVVRPHKSRHTCVTLAFKTLAKALAGL